MKILITGGHGFIGKHLISELKKRALNSEIIPLSRRDGFDLRDLKITQKYVKKIKPDFIFNLSSHVGSVHYSTIHAADIIYDNTEMSLNLYKAVQEYAPLAKIINPLSNCSYPGDADIHYEPDWWKGEVHDSVIASGNSRRMLYVISKCFNMQYGIKTYNFLVPNSFGPGDYTDPNKTHALNGMIIRMLKAHKNKEKIFEIWGTGKPIREWGYVKDIVRILSKSLTLKTDLIYPVNIAQNKGYSIKESAHMIKEAIGFKGKIVFNTKYQDGAARKILDNRRFKKIFPNFMFTDHKQGIEETIKYYNKVL